MDWITPKVLLASKALFEFGRGFREGRKAPAFDIDFLSIFKEGQKKEAKAGKQKEKEKENEHDDEVENNMKKKD